MKSDTFHTAIERADKSGDHAGKAFRKLLAIIGLNSVAVLAIAFLGGIGWTTSFLQGLFGVKRNPLKDL